MAINAYITGYTELDQSDAMRAVTAHACDWLLTVDCLTYFRDGLTPEEAARVADAGFRGDDLKAARRFLATLNHVSH